jgi:serine/threonine protein kinase
MVWHRSIIGVGGSAFVTCTDGKTVLKGQDVWENGRHCASFEHPSEEHIVREDAIYRLLGPHPQILTCFGLEEIHPGVRALRLELAPLGDLRCYLEKHPNDPPPLPTRLNMILDIACGLAHIHSRAVWHSDLSTKNIFLFSDFRVKLGDFASAVAPALGYDSGALEDQDYELPCRGRDFRERPRYLRELFALGSAMYEILSWEREFPGVAEDEMDQRLKQEAFPPVNKLLIGDIIKGCWTERYSTVDEVLQDLIPRISGVVCITDGFQTLTGDEPEQVELSLLEQPI